MSAKRYKNTKTTTITSCSFFI